MEIGDKLYPEKMKAQCDSAIQILEKDNLAIEQVQKHLQDFILDDELVSESYSALKLQISDYLAVTSAMITANELDLEDLKTLKASVGNRILLGDVILPNMDSAREDIIRYEEAASEYARKAAGSLLFSSARNYYRGLAAYYETRALLARARYAFWESQNNTFDEINTSTRNLMTQGSGFREAARQGMESITKSFQDGVYCIDLNAPWRAALGSENSKQIEQLKAQFLKKTEDGKTEYDWKKIEKWLKQDAEDVSDLEYLAFIDLMSEMSNEELQDLFSAAQIFKAPLFMPCYSVSEVMKEAAGRYQVVAQLEAELTVFNEHSRLTYDETEVINFLSRAVLIGQIVDRMDTGTGDHCSVTISSEEREGKITYGAELIYVRDHNSGSGTTKSAYTQNIKVNPWGKSQKAQEYLNECEAVSFNSLNSSLGSLLGEAGGEYAAGMIFEQIGKMTCETVGKGLSTTLTAAGLISDIKECQENAVIINGGLDMIDSRRTVEALGIQGGVVSVTGSGINSAELYCCKYDPEELLVRVEVYNSTLDEGAKPITPEELKASAAGDGELLKEYVDWYWKYDGAEDIEEYWRELTNIAMDYNVQNPQLVLTDPEEMNLSQLQELINKRNDPSYEINLEVMKGTE